MLGNQFGQNETISEKGLTSRPNQGPLQGRIRRCARKMMKRSLVGFLGLFALLLVVSSAGAADIYRDWELKQVERQILLQTQNARVQIHLVAQNVGSKAASTLHLAFPADTASHIAHIVASQDSKLLSVSPVANDGDAEVDYFQIELGGGQVEPQGQVTVDVAYVLSHVQQPFPTHIGQHDNQLVTYADTLYLFSPYPVRTQKTLIKLPSPKVESFTQEGVTPAPLQRGDAISYGPFQDVKPLQGRPLKVHFENNTVLIYKTINIMPEIFNRC